MELKRYVIQQALPGLGVTLQLQRVGRFPSWAIALQPDKRAGDALAHGFIRRVADERRIIKRKLAAIGYVESGKAIEERGLAGAVGADQAINFTLVEGE